MGKHLFLQCISFLVSTLFFIFYAFKEDNTEKKANTVSSKSRKSKVKQSQKIKQSRKIKNTTNNAVDNDGFEVCKVDSVRGQQQQKKANLAVSRTKTNTDRIKMRASSNPKLPGEGSRHMRKIYFRIYQIYLFHSLKKVGILATGCPSYGG